MDANVNANTAGLPAGEFEKIFLKANVLTEGLNNAKSAKSKATKIGNFLSPHVGSEVAINVNGRTGKAKLCMTQGRANKKLYHFEVRWDDAAAATDVPEAADAQLDDGVGAPTVAAGIASDDAHDNAAAEQQVGDGAGNDEEWQ